MIVSRVAAGAAAQHNAWPTGRRADADADTKCEFAMPSSRTSLPVDVLVDEGRAALANPSPAT